MSITTAQAANVSRWDRIQACINAAKFSGVNTQGYYIVALVNAIIDSGSQGGLVLLNPSDWFNSFAAHEMGHSYGLQHSFSDDTTCQPNTWSKPGEYCNPWDLMSVQNAYMFNFGTFGNSGPGLSAPNLERLGWIPTDRIYTMGYSGDIVYSVSLYTLSRYLSGAPAGAMLAVRIPYDPGNKFVYYTVEFRLREGWDSGIPRAAVIINEVRADGSAYLVTNSGGPEWLPGETFSRAQSGTTITVNINSMNETRGTILITVYSDFAQRCLIGWVWRGATSTDRACVTSAVRDQVQYDNTYAKFYNCPSGYVWRLAQPNDYVCVTPAVRDQTAADNADQARRVNPARFIYGPLTCKSGYVWREADKYDYVCVQSWERDRVRADNAAAASRWVSGAYGPFTCISGYVWREAYPGDKVCTTPDFRQQCQESNAQYGASMLEKP
jgi:hypothetical protein